MGAYALRPSGAARLLEALRATQPDVSSIVLDVWVARRVVDPRAGLSVCVWDQTNHLFRHGDERISMRKDQNGGIERPRPRAVRTMRGGDDKGHPIILPTGLRVDVSEVVGPCDALLQLRHRSVLPHARFFAMQPARRILQAGPRLLHHARRPRAPPLGGH